MHYRQAQQALKRNARALIRLTADKTARVRDAKGFQSMFAPDRLTLGVFFPIEAFKSDEPTMRDQERLARRAEDLGFAGDAGCVRWKTHTAHLEETT